MTTFTTSQRDQLVREVVKRLIKLKSSNMHPSDADWYIGFGGVDTANEDKIKRDNGIGYQKLATMFLNPIKERS